MTYKLYLTTKRGTWRRWRAYRNPRPRALTLIATFSRLPGTLVICEAVP